jgi:hypothetical protein
VLVVRGCTRGRLLECLLFEAAREGGCSSAQAPPSRSSVGAYIPLLYKGEAVFEYRHLYRRRRRLLERFPPLSPFLVVLRLAFLSFPLSFPSCSPFFFALLSFMLSFLLFFLLSFGLLLTSFLFSLSGSPSCSPHHARPVPPPHALILAYPSALSHSCLLNPRHSHSCSHLPTLSFLLTPPHARPLAPLAPAPPRIPQTM